jgi:hypothetical protein
MQIQITFILQADPVFLISVCFTSVKFTTQNFYTHALLHLLGPAFITVPWNEHSVPIKCSVTRNRSWGGCQMFLQNLQCAVHFHFYWPTHATLRAHQFSPFKPKWWHRWLITYSQLDHINQLPPQTSSATWTHAPQHQGSRSIFTGHPGKKTSDSFEEYAIPIKIHSHREIFVGNYKSPTSSQDSFSLP